MSFKAIEMQVALPRTFEASKMHEQMQQRSQIMQDHLMEQGQKEDVKKRQTVLKPEKKEGANSSSFRDSYNSKEPLHPSNRRDKEKENKESIIDLHPYKGTVVDFSG